MELNPNGDGEWFYRGDAHGGLRQWDKAIADYSTAIKRNPRHAWSWANRGWAHMELGQWAAGAADYAKAVELADGSESSFFRNRRALCLARAGNLDQAARDADDLARAGDALALYNAACVYAVAAGQKDSAGGPEAAEARARRAVELLRQAMAAGYKDLLWLVEDNDLDAVRDREDFRKLLADLEAKAPPAVQARYHIRASRWAEAAAAYAKADLSARPLNDDACACACLFLIRGDSEGYDRFCQDMIRRAGQTKDHFEAFILARTCGTARKGAVDPARVVEWAAQAVAGAQPAWYFHVLGLAQYRAGQFEQALQSFAKADVGEGAYRGLNWFGLALVHHRLGHPDEARQCLAKGIQWLEREGPPGPERPTKLSPQDWLEAQLLRREAEELINPKSNEDSDKK